VTQAGEAARTTAEGRPAALRLARVHLRLGSLALARAELEALSGRALLDDDGLLDLAEARWRTGDLTGAGDAAIALVDRGREDIIALVIAAEAIAAAGRPTEARRLANRAIEGTGEPLDALFAGMPRSAIWPVEDTGDGAVDALIPDSVTVDSASPAAVDAFASGRAALAAGDSTQAALRLAVALRLEPGFAESVLESVSPHASEPAIALVAGDALRLLGRETEARAAYDVARGAASAGPAPAASTGDVPETTGAAGPADGGAGEREADDDGDDEGP
jgi:tetratricopeptide (TPR) repeat protein